jgi:acyl-CoA reductase-like NAD-dependent aldehyde dehydrogenase
MEFINSKNTKRTEAYEIGKATLNWFDDYNKKITSGKIEINRVSCFDPSLGKEIWTVPNHGPEYINHLVRRAHESQKEWAKRNPSEKANILNACADAIEAQKEKLAIILALETGKSLKQECIGEVNLLIAIFRYFSGLAYEIKGKSIQSSSNILGFTTFHPWGVVAGIVPWNVPLMFMAYKVAASLVSGNTVIIKAPEQATASIIFCYRAILPFLPDGILDFISGEGSQAGNSLITHPQVNKISFTGSVETGKIIHKQAADSMKSVTLELGGKSPMIILEDCDIDKAITGIIGSMRFTRAGQSCTASSRIYVPSSQMELYRAKLAKALNSFVIGDALNIDTDCGPLVTSKHKKRVNSYINKARLDGLDVATYGKIDDKNTFKAGYYVQPHVIYNPGHDHAVSQEEIFGPVVTISGYDNIDDAVKISNDTVFGLSASVWGKDISKCLKIADAFQAGIVQINQNAIMLPGFSYGGIGISGVGKESSLEAMLSNYMYEKTNIVNFMD